MDARVSRESTRVGDLIPDVVLLMIILRAFQDGPDLFQSRHAAGSVAVVASSSASDDGTGSYCPGARPHLGRGSLLRRRSAALSSRGHGWLCRKGEGHIRRESELAGLFEACRRHRDKKKNHATNHNGKNY